MLHLPLKNIKHWICKIESTFFPKKLYIPKQVLMNKLIDIKKNEIEAVSLARKLINKGGVVALPTDTVYGLAADAQNPVAISKLYNIKGRNLQKPIALCTHRVEDISNWCEINHLSFGLLDALLPGPVSVILRRKSSLNLELNPGEPNIAIRVPNSGFICNIVSDLKKPIALTSANESNKPSTLEPIEFSTLWPKLDAIFDGGIISCSSESRQGSTIIDLTVSNHYSIVRTGSALLNTIHILHQFGLKEL